MNFFATYSKLTFFTLAILFFSCQKEKKLDADFITNEFNKTEDFTGYTPDYAMREKQNQLGAMDSDVMLRLPVNFDGFELSSVASSELPIDLSEGYKMVPLKNMVKYNYTIRKQEYETHTASFELEDFNGRKNEYLQAIRTIINNPKLKDKKVYNIDSVNNAVGIMYTEVDNVVGGTFQYITAFFYDRFVMTVWIQDKDFSISNIKPIIEANIKAMAPYKTKAYPEIKNRNILGQWVVSEVEVSDDYVKHKPSNMLALGDALGMDFKEAVKEDFKLTTVGKYVFHLDSTSIVQIELDNKPLSKTAFIEGNDSVYFAIDNKRYVFFQSAKGEMAVQPGNPSDSPLFYVKKK